VIKLCEITGATKVNGNFYLGGTSYDGDFMNAKLLRIFDENGDILETRDFLMDRTRTCFTPKISPWIMLKKDVPDKFLCRGNKIEFDYN